MSFADHFKAFHEIEIDNHIRLRRHQPQQDAEAFFHICSDRDAFRFFGRETYPGDQYTDAFVHVLESRIKGFRRKNEYAWVIEYDGEPIGQIQLYDFQKITLPAPSGIS